VKRSALFHHHKRMGATFGDRHGWEIPRSFSAPKTEAAGVRNGVGLADISYRSKFEVRSQPERNWWRLAAGRYLIIGEPPLEAPPDAIEVTSVYTNLLLAGPRAKDTLSKLTSLNTSETSLPNLSCASASVAHAHAIVLREDNGAIPAYHLLFTRDYAVSVWESILHAGHEFSLLAFGIEALESLLA
jgi:glycine cleavage system aminomethyltransferase T